MELGRRPVDPRAALTSPLRPQATTTTNQYMLACLPKLL
jgi:hypothetical protein